MTTNPLLSQSPFLNHLDPLPAYTAKSPHMRTLYGDQIRKEAGLTKTLKTSIATARKTALPDMQRMIGDNLEFQAYLNGTRTVERVVKETVEKVERVMEETAEAMGGFVEAGV